jgi:hypothetical protein
MRFGGPELAMRLRVARVIVYCQALLLGLIAVFTIETLMMGSGAGIRFQGIFTSQTLTGNAATLVIVVQVVAAIVLIAVNQAAEHSTGFRWLLTAAETVVGVYLVVFISDTVSTWVLGPVVCAIVIALHHWPATQTSTLETHGPDSPGSPPL